MSFLDSLAGYAPYVAPIIERNRQRDLQAAMLKQQQDRQAAQDKIAAAMAQSNISHNAATADEAAARAASLRAPTAKKEDDVLSTQVAPNGDIWERTAQGWRRGAMIPEAPTAPQTPPGQPTGDIDLRDEAGGRSSDMQAGQPPQAGPSAPRVPKPPVQSAGPAPVRQPVTLGQKPPTPAAIPYNLTPPGITADSTRAAKVAQAEAPYKKDPNAAPSPTYTPFQGTDPTTGKAVVRPFNTKTGAFGDVADVAPKGTPSGLAAPMAAKVGQFGEMLKKTADLMPATEALEMKLGSSAAQDVASHGVGFGSARIPGTKGLGSMMLSKTPEAATYQAALTPFILAAAHALSGARINDTQVQQIRASVEITPGMSPQERAQKKKNLVDLINSIGGSLPPDAIGQQESQMDATALERLKGYGYKGSGASQVQGGGRGGGAGATQQQKDWDAAAAYAKSQGLDPVAAIGHPRP